MANSIRINFNDATSKTYHWEDCSDGPAWVALIFKDFQNAYDSKFINSYSKYLVGTKGIQYIVSWLKEQGYKAEYWEMDFSYNEAQGPNIIAYGITFQEDCEKFIELKLRAST